MTHLISTTAKPGHCPRCRRPILAAIDAGLATQVDPEPIPPGQEVAALIAGLWTYSYRAGYLIHRDAYAIRTNHTDPIHAEHRCQKRKTKCSK